jgi:folylpolyglutamate synthase/dihydropteroate synthase
LLGLNKYIEKGILGYYWPGRYETIVFQNNTFIIDAAHNPASIDALVEYLNLNYPSRNDFQIIFAALQTKNWKYFIDKLKDFIVSWHIVLADSDVAVNCNEIVNYLSCLGINNIQEYGLNYETAILKACENQAKETIVAGSMYMIGGLKKYLNESPKLYWET